MVRIIGVVESAVKQATCNNCASLLEYTQSEVQVYRGTDYSGGADGREWIDCPKCGKMVVLKSW